ncbi:aspartate aminotransferase family protein [Nocardia sp. NPDC050710]|uniref:aspartate aminotransferase family protein n=1 Tax=Nocardia sp. NPDC050710 TaxID=3157220 RepID=UPI0033FE4165
MSDIKSRGNKDAAKITFKQIKRHFSPSMALAGKFTGQGAVEDSADGCRVTLSDGRTVLDFGSYAVALLGHRNAAVVDAVQAQLDRMPTSTRTVLNPLPGQAAETVVDYLAAAEFGGEQAPELTKVYFGCGGADSVEAGIKLARLATGRATVLAVEGAYHGKTLGALALTHHQRFKGNLGPVLSNTVHLDPADPDAVSRAIAENEVAALIFEPVQGENGVTLLDPAVLSRWCADAQAHGAFVIADEIQVGLRRCGDRSVALAYGLPVDAVLLAKAIGGGVVPISALVCTEALYAPLADDPVLHTATFSGYPLGAAAVAPALTTIEAHVADGIRIAGEMADGLARLAADYDTAINAVRGRGLLWGVDFCSPEFAGEVQVGLAQRGLVISTCLSRPEVLRLIPPIIATSEDVAEALFLLRGAIEQAAALIDPTRTGLDASQ